MLDAAKPYPAYKESGQPWLGEVPEHWQLVPNRGLIRKRKVTPLLFVRERKSLPGGLASPYAFLGPADYVSHEGSRPVSIFWRLRTPMPTRLARVAVG